MKWWPLIVGGGWNPELRRAFDGASGAYAIRHKGTHKVEYVGESHTGRGWTTLTRHFQDASGKFATRNQKWGGEGMKTWTRAKPGDYEAAVWVTSRGLRKKESSDEGAMRKQAQLIKRYDPPGNRDDGMAADDFAFGANAKNPNAKNPRDPFLAHLSGDEWSILKRGAKQSVVYGIQNDRTAAWMLAKLNRYPVEKQPEGPWTTNGSEIMRSDGLVIAIARTEAIALSLAARANPRQKKASGPHKNPSTGLVVLGWGVSLVYTTGGHRRVKRWGVRDAPIVAYDPAKKTGALVLIFAPSIIGKASSRGSKEYKRTHWGQAGDGDRLDGEVLQGVAPYRGTAKEITYATAKGTDAELVDYWHTFGDYGDLSLKTTFTPPRVESAKVGGRELWRLSGGSYTVDKHGIVG